MLVIFFTAREDPRALQQMPVWIGPGTIWLQLDGEQCANSRSMGIVGLFSADLHPNQRGHEAVLVSSGAPLDGDVYRQIEAIANLLYLVRVSLDDPESALAFVEMAEERTRQLLRLQMKRDEAAQ